MEAKKGLGQHWLKDGPTLQQICQAANLLPDDTVLEVGPGLGDLTKYLVNRAGRVIAVEVDQDLANKLRTQIEWQNLDVVNQDIREFDLTTLPPNYKVVANIPYYLTSYLVRLLSETTNQPKSVVLLVQKEVAERLAAKPGQMSLLSVTTQFYYLPQLGQVVPAEMFEPPPKVDSQIITLARRPRPLFAGTHPKVYFQLVKAGFAGRRKKLRSSLAAGLRLSKPKADEILTAAGVNPDSRAQELSLDDWHGVYKAFKSIKM